MVKTTMLYYKNEKGEFLPIDVSLFDINKIPSSFMILRVGGEGFNPQNKDLDNIKASVEDYLKKLGVVFRGIILHDKVTLETIDLSTMKDKVLVVKVGDPNLWKPSEKYLRDVKEQFELATEGHIKVVVIDAVSGLEY